MTVRAILFDVGGPIDMEFAWEIAVDGAIASACGLEGIRVDQAMVEAASDAAVEAFAQDAYACMVDHLCGGDPETATRVNRRRRAMVSELTVFQMRPDMPALLRRLADRGVKLGAVANQPAAMAERLAREGIADLFSHLGLSGLSGFRKPDPRAFTSVAEALGVTPGECIMVGDRIDDDIVPAKSLGMAAILFRSGRHRRQRPRGAAEEPDAIVTDVMELDAALRELLSSR
jgi:putative hydrolase of the HAD superfamily